MDTRGERGMIIDVMHECADGWHTFTSPQVPGLFLTAEMAQLEEIYAEIPTAIAALAKADFGKDVKAELVKSYSDYAAGLPETHQPVTHYEIRDLAA